MRVFLWVAIPFGFLTLAGLGLFNALHNAGVL
jgi:hypothetical protein